jgi:DNA-binding NarL/FixJ family response regulator
MNERSMTRSRPGPVPRSSDVPGISAFAVSARAHADAHGQAPADADGDSPAGVPLSRPEVDLLGLLADGLPLAVVAREVHASERTVRRRLRAICDRLGFSAPIQAVAWAARRGLV